MTMASPPPGFSGRLRAGFVTFNDKLFIFGGGNNNVALGDAAIYDPATDSWSLVVDMTNAPSARWGATLLWTGREILVYGGRATLSGPALTSGASFDPATGLWSPIASGLVGHVLAIGGATASQAFIWGGWGATTGSTLVGTAERYTTDTAAWAAASTTSGAPGTLQDPAWTVTETGLLLWGGLSWGNATNQFWSYDLLGNSWTSLGAFGTTARSGAFGVWDSRSFVVWAGRGTAGVSNTGWIYDGGLWTAMDSANAPTARYAAFRETGWAFAVGVGNIVFLGGRDSTGKVLSDGGMYGSSPPSGSATWNAIANWNSGEQHLWAVAAYAGGEVLIWGGNNGTADTATGERWAP